MLVDRVKRMPQGLRRSRGFRDTRQSVTYYKSKKLISALQSICRSQYEYMLFATSFSLAYIAPLRVSELTSRNKKSSDIIKGGYKQSSYIH